METLFLFLNQHIQFAPYITFGLLLLAGLNFPFSEDVMIIFSALLAIEYPEQKVALFLGVYLGALGSDIISYSLGRFLGPKLWKIPFFARALSQDKLDKVSHFYQRYGVLILFPGRFIPFGVRNALFLGAGFGKMNFKKFFFTDWMACTISNFTLFALTYVYGKEIMTFVKKSNKIIFLTACTLLLLFFLRKKIQRSQK